MNALPVRRPLGCLKTIMRQTRYQRTFQRPLATEASSSSAQPTPPSNTTPAAPANFRLFKPKTHKPTPFAVYAPAPKPPTAPKDPLPSFLTTSLEALDPTGARTALFSRARKDRAKVGDVLMVSTGRGEPFAGALMQIRRRGVDTAIQLRGQLMKTGVEMWYKVYSPAVVGIDIIWRRPRRARRARLTYLRKKKHDMGSVDHLVWAWKRERSQLRSSKKGKGVNMGTVF